MIELNDKVKQALNNINFVKRYEELSNEYSDIKTPMKLRLELVDIEEVIDTIKDLGYEANFIKKEKYFHIQDTIVKEYTFSCNIILFGGTVDIVWIVKKNEDLILGSPWGTYAKRLISPQYKIKKPIFGTYDDLEKILQISFVMFEEFKETLLTL